MSKISIRGRPDNNIPHIQICSLEAAREADLDIYDGVITIEDTTTEDPLRISGDNPRQLVLRFDDISRPIDNFVMPDVKHILSVFNFVKKWEQPSLLIHCHAGMSRSPAISLAVIAEKLGPGREVDAVNKLLEIVPLCTPNQYLIDLIDDTLECSGSLVKSVNDLIRF